MAIPSSRDEFKANCLRRLGAPVLEINVDDGQVEDRIDEALSYFYDFHYDGTEKCYYKAKLTAGDIQNRFITLPSNIIGAVRVFDLGLFIGADNFFNVRYQIALNDLYTLTSQSLVPYFMAMQHLATMQELLVGHQPIRYNRKNNRLYIDTAWDQFAPGQFVVVEAYGIIDPDSYDSLWSDRWLQRYATALIKRQWADNLSKYTPMSLPGGLAFNADKLSSQSDAEIEKLEEEMRTTYSLPPDMMIG